MSRVLYGPPADTLAILLDDPEEHDFASPERILRGLPAELAVRKPAGWPHSIAEILAHMNANVQFNLGLIRSAEPASYQNPVENWPRVEAGDWDKLVEQFITGLEELKRIALNSPSLDRILYPATAEPAWTVGYKLAASVAKHNAYHLGQIAVLRRILGAWKEVD